MAGRPVASATLGLHAVVMLILVAAYREAPSPLKAWVAMAIRIAVWLAILALLWEAGIDRPDGSQPQT